jgi:hypothetical protein
VNIPVKRLKWSTAVSALTSISGLAVGVDGDVIVTGAGATATANTDTVFALKSDGSGIRWNKGTNWYGNNNELGQIDGAPSIGAAATSPPIYVATLRRDFIALNPADGSRVWQCGTGQLNAVPHTPPAVVQATTGCEAVIVGDDSHRINAACMNTSTSCTKTITSANPGCNCATSSPAVNLVGKLYLGFDIGQGMTGTPFGPGVAFGTPSAAATPTSINTVTNLSTDGTQIYGLDPLASQAYGLPKAPASPTAWNATWSVATSAAVNGGSAIEPPSGGVIVNTNDKKLHALAQLDGTDTPLRTFASGNGNTPLLGSNGYMYFGNDLGSMLAVQDQAGYATAWSYTPGATPITVAPNMDCSGTLYFAAGNTVYALITDSTSGLRQGSPWPKYQRDSRNSGNADATTTFWGRDTGSGCTQ